MKNWTVKEAAKVIRENKDAEAVKEIVKHFPLFAVIVAGKDFDGLTDAMPEHMTVRKIENELNNGSTGDADVEDDEDQAEDDTAAEDLENMSTKQLIALCGKRGIKVPKYGKNKQFYLDALNGAGDEDEDADAEETEEEEDPVALYKKCKKAGLKVAPKKSAKYYKDQLAKAAAEEDDTDDEDDWDDEEEEEKPAKKAPKKAPAKKGAKKPAKKSEPEEDDDEDDEDEDEWDI
jgi:hypothetical protein